VAINNAKSGYHITHAEVSVKSKKDRIRLIGNSNCASLRILY
jgi:hypothetical protein